MDTRFPPQPKRIKVPLYPQLGKLIPASVLNKNNSLMDLMSQILGMNKDKIILANSASDALYEFLRIVRVDRNKKLLVGMPSFNCIDVAEAVVAAGCTPVFTDIDKSLMMTEKNIDFMIAQKCEYFIWPNFFGARHRDRMFAEKLIKNNIKIILDEAQSFPFYYDEIKPFVDKYAHLVLISFGHSKPISGVGGGAIFMNQPNTSFQKMKGYPEESRNEAYFNLVKKVMKQRINWRSPRIAKKLAINPKREKKLEVLLNQRIGKKKYDPISRYQSQVAYKNLKTINSKKFIQSYSMRYEKLNKLLKSKEGSVGLNYLNQVIGEPASIALSLDPNRRYEIFTRFSNQSIETTWYYYPISLLDKYRKYPCETIINTIGISSSIIIIPFRWQHSNRQINRLIDSLKVIL